MGKRAESEDIDTLRRNVEWALRNALDADEVLPMLAKLARSAEPESDAWVLAHRHLAELAVDRDPWRSATFSTSRSGARTTPWGCLPKRTSASRKSRRSHRPTPTRSQGPASSPRRRR